MEGQRRKPGVSVQVTIGKDCNLAKILTDWFSPVGLVLSIVFNLAFSVGLTCYDLSSSPPVPG